MAIKEGGFFRYVEMFKKWLTTATPGDFHGQLGILTQVSLVLHSRTILALINKKQCEILGKFRSITYLSTKFKINSMVCK